MKTIILLSLFAAMLILSSCNRTEIDNEKPFIDLTIENAFPNNCDTIYFGVPFKFKALLTDNFQLGSFSLDIHNNFDHHSHSTDFMECELSLVKAPVKPYVFINEFEIPSGLKTYLADIELTIPDNGFDEGDYHFFISLTDREGWRAEKGISIKILNR